MVQKKDRLERVIFKVILAGFFVALLGIFQKLLGADKIYWIREAHSNFFGPFINENNFASYVSMVGLVTLGNIFANTYTGKRLSGSASLRQKFLAALNMMLNKKLLFTIFAFFIMLISLFLSKSRAGIFFFATACTFFSLSVLFRKNAKKAVWFILFGALLGCLLLSWLGGDRALKELATAIYSSEYVGRVMLHGEARNILADHPLFGIGIGAFSGIFPMYRTGFRISFYEHLHNDIFQLLIELGIIGFSAVVLVFVTFLLKFLMAGAKTKSLYKYYTSLGIFASFFYLGLHSLVDFPMRINAISSLFVMLLSLALLVMHLRPRVEGASEIKLPLRKVLIIKTESAKRMFYLAIIPVFAYLSFSISRPFIAYVFAKNADSFSSFKKAVALDSKNDRLYHEYSRFMLKQYREGLIDKEIYFGNAEYAIDKALKLNPYNTSYIMAGGWFEFRRENYEKANLLLKEASLLEPNNDRIKLAYAYMLFWQGLNEGNKAKKTKLLKKGLIYYNSARYLSSYATVRSIVKDAYSYEVLKEGLKKEGIIIN